jgi:hypothetical protein
MTFVCLRLWRKEIKEMQYRNRLQYMMAVEAGEKKAGTSTRPLLSST